MLRYSDATLASQASQASKKSSRRRFPQVMPQNRRGKEGDESRELDKWKTEEGTKDGIGRRNEGAPLALLKRYLRLQPAPSGVPSIVEYLSAAAVKQVYLEATALEGAIGPVAKYRLHLGPLSKAWPRTQSPNCSIPALEEVVVK